jgi:hypothetical protein
VGRELYILKPQPGREMCDFCAGSPTVKLYACRNFMIPQTKHLAFAHESIGGWSACEKCSLLIDEGRWFTLTDRALRRFLKINRIPPGEGAEIRKLLTELHQLFREHVIKEV